MKWITRVQLLMLILLMSACASTSKDITNTADIEQFFHDEHFKHVEGIVQPDELFALSDQAKRSLLSAYQQNRMTRGKNLDAHKWLANYIDADNGGFTYYDNMTKVASETFDERMGNCLSLVLLTGAMADVLGVPVTFQDIAVPPVWDKQGSFFLVNGHINLKLKPKKEANMVTFLSNSIQVDFMPERAVRAYGKEVVDRNTVMAMFYNNVAAESLVMGDYDKAYQLLKTGLTIKPDYVPTLNTLAVLYRYKKMSKQAESVYKFALSLKDEDMNTLYNYAILLASQDRLTEWAEVHKVLELARIRNPYYYYDMAQQAYFEMQYEEAVVWYKRAVEKADYRHEFYFGLSRAYWATGDESRARTNLQKALALTSDDGSKQRYQAKLHAMQSH
ncbi:tetratricopeptide repeat protein [Shewanella waksmanii]|uniref:tetratricopeptide repeat protein n=1 Tax=Shewanella waksmanii TaxID=213783 RepID=UPI003735E45B